jgi:hypothetical protein
MSIIQKEIHKCDNCGKTEERENTGEIGGWYRIEIWRYFETRGMAHGETEFNKEVCSKKCATEILKKFGFPKPKPHRMICHL